MLRTPNFGERDLSDDQSVPNTLLSYITLVSCGNHLSKKADTILSQEFKPSRRAHAVDDLDEGPP